MPRNELSTTSIGKAIGGAGGSVVEVVVEIDVELVVVVLEVGADELEGGDVTAATTVDAESVDDWTVVVDAVSSTETLADEPSSEPELQAATAAINNHDMTGAAIDEQRIHPGWQGEPRGERM